MHRCDVDAEPLHRYQPGGYHPVRLGDVLHGGRYTIVHKLGWGGYSTTWAARDSKNLAVQVPGIQSMEEDALLRVLGTPETAPVSRLDGRPLDGNVPSYLVWPAPFRAKELLRASPAVKIIDFGEAFFADDSPKTLHTPLTTRCHRGGRSNVSRCCKSMRPFAAAYADSGDEKVPTLQEWFEEIYFDEQRTAEFTKEDVQAVGHHLVGQLLKFEPGSWATARDLLASPWFR
ncbi:serine protein kinase [Ophiostoma piceae UAMH 11346]|uniref:non-specific serine/threonine protein kinase n=1 Tax=Ophiostoma piceae (strain UAMH 11346) TaxID=1262450 RepID=S3BZ27_OPHP1|nr:serine protein kinase [Ophiostoma piceae UAMH 11346]